MIANRYPLAARIALVALLALPAQVRAADRLVVCATTPDLGSLVREVAGDAVDLTTFAKPGEDAHFVVARPSYVRRLADADVLVRVGMDLELGWLPALVRQARNRRIVPGAPGDVDGSTGIIPLDVPGVVDRALGDVHPMGNPHYLLDPIEGLRVARLVRDRLSALDPGRADAYARRTEDFGRRLGEALCGAALHAKYNCEKLARLAEHGRLEEFLASQGDAEALGGWFRATAPHRGARVVVEHALWPYFARRFGVEIAGTIEPKPGVPPSTAHLAGLVDAMNARGVRAIVSTPYFDPAPARFLAERTGAAVAPLAHQPGARAGTDEYLAMVDHNVRALVGALASRTGEAR